MNNLIYDTKINLKVFMPDKNYKTIKVSIKLNLFK